MPNFVICVFLNILCVFFSYSFTERVVFRIQFTAQLFAAHLGKLVRLNSALGQFG